MFNSPIVFEKQIVFHAIKLLIKLICLQYITYRGFPFDRQSLYQNDKSVSSPYPTQKSQRSP
jgi:hypothetical protein